MARTLRFALAAIIGALFYCCPSEAAIALACHASGQSANQNSVTTSACNTTGATLIVLQFVGNALFSGSMTSNVSADATCLTSNVAATATAGGTYVRMYYCNNPTGNAAETFSVTGGFTAPSLFVEAFTGTTTTSPFDQANGGNSGFGTSGTAGSITTTANGDLIVTGFGAAATVTTINSVSSPTMTITDNIAPPTGNGYAGAIAWSTQTTAGAINPTWNWSGSYGGWDAINASFKAAASAGPPHQLMTLGMGNQ